MGSYDQPEKMHREHMETRRVHLAWLDDLRRYRMEHRALLRRLESALEGHEDLLDAHQAAINEHARYLENHEHLIFRQESASGSLDSTLLLNRAFMHEEMKDRHGVVAGQHAQLKEQHHRVMAHLLKVVKELETMAPTPKL